MHGSISGPALVLPQHRLLSLEAWSDDQLTMQLALVRKYANDSAELTASIDNVMTAARKIIATWLR